MTGVFNVKKPAIWHTTDPVYDASTAINMDTLPLIALIKYHYQAHQHATEVTPLIGMIGQPLGIIVTPDILAMIIKIGPALVIPNPTHITMGIGVAAIMTPIGATPGHSTDLPNIASHATEGQVHTTIAKTHHTLDLHPVVISPKMTADLDTNPKNNITNQHKDLLQAHKQHHENIKTRHKQITIDDPPSKYYSSENQDSDSGDDLN